MELEQAQLQQCSFKPKVNDAKLNKEEYRPIQERIGDIQRAKNERLAQARLSQQADEEGVAYHRPKINPRSAKLAERRKSMDAQQMAVALRASKSEMEMVSAFSRLLMHLDNLLFHQGSMSLYCGHRLCVKVRWH
jgi:hypothetical protein